MYINNGKKLEKFVLLIQESLKNIPNTRITSNAKLKDKEKRAREIDVLIETNVNNLEIKIAIECKDYKRLVPIKEIEAFGGKCSRIPGISKKVFVSSSGYQAGAIAAAKDYDIELYRLSEISTQMIVDWFPMKQINFSYKLEFPVDITFYSTESDLNDIPNDINIIIYFEDEQPPIELVKFLWNSTVYKEQRMLRSIMILEFVKRDNFDDPVILKYNLELGGVYIKGRNGEKFYISKISGNVLGYFLFTPANYIEASIYEKGNSEIEASIVSLDIGQQGRAEVVYTEKDVSIFHTSKLGQVSKLETLALYDKKTDKLEIIKDT